jgi:hypothetical protein
MPPAAYHTVCAVCPRPPEVRARVLRAWVAPAERDPSRPCRAPPIHCGGPRVPDWSSPTQTVPDKALKAPPPIHGGVGGGARRRRGREVRSREAVGGGAAATGGGEVVGLVVCARARALRAKREWRCGMRAHMLAYAASRADRAIPRRTAAVHERACATRPDPHPHASRPACNAPPSAGLWQAARGGVGTRRRPHLVMRQCVRASADARGGDNSCGTMRLKP